MFIIELAAGRAAERMLLDGDVGARDLLMPYGDIVIVLSIVLRIKRTLDGADINKIIANAQARNALAIEHRRRADWRKRELAASSFQAKWAHVDAALLLHDV